MFSRIKKQLGFPYPAQYEAGFYQSLMQSMHKPLLIAVVAVLLFVSWLVGICIFWPDAIAPPQYIDGLLRIHFTFLIFTVITLLISVAFRRQMFEKPKMNIALCNGYAIGICLWGSVLSAYANYSPAIYIAFITITLCAAMVSLFKPWLAIVVFGGNYLIYLALANAFVPAMDREMVGQLYSAALAAVLGMVIAIAFYRFRTRTYYGRQIIAQQMKEINKINRQLQQLVHIDNLSGLFNRRFYEEALPGELEKIKEHSGVGCMMFDVDFFKAYNDQYGHPAGDECLRRVSKIIKDSIPQENAFAVRYGGEEFLVLAAIAAPQDALELAKAVCRTVEEAYIIHAGSGFGRVTISCGLSCYGKAKVPALAEMTAQADEALYASKNGGRNRVTLFVPKS